MNIEDTIGIALDDIAEVSPKLADTIHKLDNSCFKTIIKNNEGKVYTIVDFTMKQLYDAQSFIIHSRNLYNEFVKYNDMYKQYDKVN
jgi:hypothetical protein